MEIWPSTSINILSIGTWVTFGGAHRGVMVFGRCPDWGVFFGGGIYGRDSLSFTVCYWDWSLLP